MLWFFVGVVTVKVVAHGCSSSVLRQRMDVFDLGSTALILLTTLIANGISDPFLHSARPRRG